MANSHILKRVRSFLSLLGRKHILLILLLLAIAFALRVIWIDAPVVRDEADGGYISMIWPRGYSLYSYSDATRPPLFYAFYAVSNLFSPPNVLLIRLMADTIFWISVVFFYVLVRDRFGLKEAVVATLLYSIFMNIPIFEGMLAIPEGIVTPLLVISLSACNTYFKNGHKSWLMASGFICAGAYLMLQNQALGIVVVFLFVLETKALRAKDLKSCLRDIVIVGVSFAIPILLTVSMFFFSGEVNDLIRVLLAERSLSNYSYASTALPLDVEVLKILEGLPLWFFGAIGTFGIFKRRSLALPLSWSAIMLALAEIPPDFPHRLMGLIPPAAILSSIGLLSSARALKKWTRKANTVAALLLVVLMLPPLLFTAVQYPTTNISWAGFGWNNTWVTSSSDQMAIARFIVSESKNGSVLIHGWLPELYWLSGKMAPSLYVYTWNAPGGFENIPPNEYAKIVAEIKEERFEMILFPTWLEPDEIINTTENTYVLTNTIYDFYVYEAYPIEEGVNYSFIAEFHNAQAYALLPNGNQMPIAELNNTVVIPRLETLTVNNITQYAIFQHPLLIQSNITYSNIQIPVNATLEFSIAIDPAVWNKTGEGVQFEIAINSNGLSNEIFSNYINPKANLEDRKWFFYSIPLQEYANKVVSISFITRPGPLGDNNWDWAYWGNPLIR